MFVKNKPDIYMVAFNQYKYNFASKNVSTDEIRCRCVKRTCSATLYTSNSKVVNEDDIDQIRHNHYSFEQCTELNRQIVSVSCKRKASENLYKQQQKIILKVILENI